jgi:hypothetical protein
VTNVRKDEKIESAADLEHHVPGSFLEGNAKILTEYFQKSLGKEDVRVAYIGDHYLSDTHATHEFNTA